MKKHVVTVLILIIVMAVCYYGMKRVKRKKLLEQVRDAYGDMPGLEEKTNAQLKELLKSRNP